MKALITGASSGIGRDIATELAKRGYDLILVARNIEKLNQVKENILTNCNNINIKIIQMDVSTPENCKNLYNQVNDDIDILINNAGFGVFGDFTKTDIDKEIQLINTNITAVHILTKLFLQDMEKKNKGHILNVASIAGFMPGPLMATYSLDKDFALKLTSATLLKFVFTGPGHNIDSFTFEFFLLSSSLIASDNLTTYAFDE